VASDVHDIALAAVEVFCEARIPEEHLDEVRLECSSRGNTITITERRAPWNPDRMGTAWTSSKIAQLRFDPSSRRWALFYRDRNERWWPYDNIGISSSVDPLLREIDTDPTGIFWG
jgi:hypothetical protein